MNFIGNDCKIDPTAVIGDDCVIGDNTIIRKNVVIGDHVTIGECCILGEMPTLWDIDGNDSKCLDNSLIIGNNVTIKSHTVIERGGSTEASVIGDYTMIGPFCYLSHDAHIGEHCLLFPYVFFCGNVTLKDRVLVFSHTTIFNHIVLEDNTTIFHGTNVRESTEGHAFIIGQNGDTLQKYCKDKRFLRHASKTLQRIKNLEDTVNGKNSRKHQKKI